MTNDKKKELVEKLNINPQTKDYIQKMYPNCGSVILNEGKKDAAQPDFKGYGKLSDGTVVSIAAHLTKTKAKGTPMFTMTLVEVPKHMYEDGHEPELDFAEVATVSSLQPIPMTPIEEMFNQVNTISRGCK